MSPKDLTRMLRRRLGMILAVVVTVTGIGTLVAYILPPIYVASAKILVESQTIPTELASSTVTSSTAERLEIIEQRLMTRSNLLELIDRLDLFADRPEMSPADQVEAMRENTSFERITLDDGRRGGARVSAFTLSYRDTSAVRAASVANEMVTIALEQNLRARSERAAETTDFFEREVAELSRELGRVEAKIAAFKQANDAALPGSLEFRRSELLAVQERIFELKRREIVLEERRSELETAIATGTGALPAEGPLTPRERRLQQLEQDLAQAESVYAPSHPVIKRLTAQIEAMSAPEPGAETAGAETGAAAPDPARSRAERELALIGTEIELVRAERAEAEARETALKVSIDRTPQVALDLAQLEREYANLERQYDVAVAKEAAAETGEKLEVSRNAERFEVIESAQVPDRPESPNRVMIAAGGAAGSVGLALALTVLLEILNKSVRTVADIERHLALRPLAAIPVIRTAREQRVRRVRRRAIALVVLVVIPAGLFLFDQYVLPLDYVADRIVERTGLSAVVYMVEQRFGL